MRAWTLNDHLLALAAFGPGRPVPQEPASLSPDVEALRRRARMALVPNEVPSP